MEHKVEQMEKELAAVRERNKRVEADKAWETSWFRVILVTVLTYGIVLLVLFLLNFEKIFLSARIPALGYFLSTQTIPLIKKWWIRAVWQK